MKKLLFAIAAAVLSASYAARTESFYYVSGLTQAKFTETYSLAGTYAIDVISHPTAELVWGTIMADVMNAAEYVNPVTGNTWKWENSNSGFGYSGEIYVVQGTEYTFGKYLDDGARIVIDGDLVLENAEWGDWWVRSYTATNTGWVTFDVRIYDGNGGKGPLGRIEWGDDLGLAFNTIGLTDLLPKSGWNPIRDPGTGSFFRTALLPFGAPPAIEFNGSQFTVSAGLTIGAGDVSALAGYQGEYDVTNLLQSGAVAPAQVSASLYGLSADTAYEIALLAKNTAGGSTVYAPGAVLYNGIVALAFEADPGIDSHGWALPGNIFACRADTPEAVRLALPVNCTVGEITGGGSVTNTLWAGTLVIPAYSDSAQIPMSAILAELGLSGTPTLAVALAPGAYVCDTADVVEFGVSPSPILGAVGITFMPDANVFNDADTTVSADIVQPGLSPLFIFVWDTEERGDDLSLWTDAYTNAAPVAGADSFALPNLQVGDTRFWRARLIGSDVYAEQAGSFTVAYTYTWVGARTGTQTWNIRSNWDIGIPNEAGCKVFFPEDTVPDLDITGVGAALTLGTLIINGNDVESWATPRIFSTDGTPIIWDNAGKPARMEWISHRHWEALIIEAPQIFTGETQIYQTQAELSFRTTSLSGAGPVMKSGTFFEELGQLTLRAPSATATNVVTVPLDADISVVSGSNGYHVKGDGTVLLQGGTHALPLGQRWYGIVVNGARLVLANSDVTNQGEIWEPNIFGGTGNEFAITAGSTFNMLKGTNVRFGQNGGASDSTLLVTDPGSLLNCQRLTLNGAGNKLLARDGGRISIHHENNEAFCVWGTGNLVGAAGSLPGQPGVIDLCNTEFAFQSDDCVLRLQSGGIVTNVSTLNLGQSGLNNRVMLEGGELICNNFFVQNGNALVPVLGTGAEILPVVAKEHAWFAEGAKITPVNLDESGATLGRFPILTAPLITLNTPLNDPAFLDPPSERFAWKLSLANGPEGQTLWLSCFTTPTLIMIR